MDRVDEELKPQIVHWAAHYVRVALEGHLAADDRN